MLGERWLPLRAAADEAGAAPVEGGAEGAVEAPAPTGPGSGRSELRQQLEKNFEQDRKRDEKAQEPPKKGKAAKRVAGGAEITDAEAPAGAAGEAAQQVEGEAAQTGQTAPIAAPEGLSAEAKAAWAQTPPAVQAAVAKRLADSAKGVEELKTKYATIDKAIAPHLEAIRRHGNTPAQAIENLFSWFYALSSNPNMAFPALAKSFNFDLAQIVAAQGQQPGQQGQQQPNGQDQQPTLDPVAQKYFQDQLALLNQQWGQKLNEVQGQVQRQSEEKTNEILAVWSKDKPYFQEVRQLMANLIQSGAVPLKDGQVDLDGAYDQAIYANPEVRAKVLAAAQAAEAEKAKAKAAAEAKAQKEQAEKARKAAVSITGTAPGAPGIPGAKPAKRKTVRESLQEAIQEHSE